MITQNAYKIEDSNIALLGSDLNHKVRTASAGKETAWAEAGKHVGLWVWRIEKFQVHALPKNQYGSFYDGDSYIVLNTFEEPGSKKLSHDLHFWLGTFTTQDEAGTAAYKTVELDDLLGGLAHQHREVQGYESELFLNLFGHNFKILSGGVESGFHHVAPEKYVPRLIHLRQTTKKKHVRMTQVPLSRDELNEGDVFIVDAGLKIYQFNGKQAQMMEKRKGGEICRAFKEERHSAPHIFIVEQGEKGSDAEEFWAFFGGVGQIKNAEEGRHWEKDHHEFSKAPKRLLILSDESGKMEMKLLAEGGHNIKKEMLNTKHIMIFDSGTDVFVWVGLKSDAAERKSALGYAQNYLTQYSRPAYIPIHKIFEGGVNEVFKSELEVN